MKGCLRERAAGYLLITNLRGSLFPVLPCAFCLHLPVCLSGCDCSRHGLFHSLLVFWLLQNNKSVRSTPCIPALAQGWKCQKQKDRLTLLTPMLSSFSSSASSRMGRNFFRRFGFLRRASSSLRLPPRASSSPPAVKVGAVRHRLCPEEPAGPWSPLRCPSPSLCNTPKAKCQLRPGVARTEMVSPPVPTFF